MTDFSDWIKKQQDEGELKDYELVPIRKIYKIAKYKRDPDILDWIMRDLAETRQREILCRDCKKWMKFHNEVIKELDQPDLGIVNNTTTCGYCEFIDKCDTWFVIQDVKK
ncbi:MAG: hypothetical protein OIN86_04635 [Candidatus Methanoperedens sp.]|nr:hypothetical protein [Candidatus Methanoperedens sp.]CAG0996633.1 hypothetical protein METP1_02610 [Methanosarcinales archaeon]